MAKWTAVVFFGHFLLLFMVLKPTEAKSLGTGKFYDINSLQEPLEYLKRYGYLGPGFKIRNYDKEELEHLQNAVTSLQKEAQLPKSGDLDAMTRKLMTLPRCGNKEDNKETQRNKRYVVYGTKLANTNVSYNIEAKNYTHDLSRELVDLIFERATRFWADASTLNFVRSENPVMRIAFSEGFHDDGEVNNFDGKGKTLAHGFFPGEDSVDLASDVHFDDAEDWTYFEQEGVALLQVATHEIGHAIGLRHSNIREAVMSAFYPGFKADFALHSDDITGITMLYGSKTTGNARMQQFNSVSSCVANYCQCGHVTAITKTPERNSYFAFYDNYVYKLTEGHVAQGYPKMTSLEFPEFSGDVGASHTLFMSEYTASIYLFQDTIAYIYQMDNTGKVIYIKHGKVDDIVVGVHGSVTSVVEYGTSKQIYLFTGETYYRLVEYGNDLYADWNYPQPTSHWDFPSSESPDAGLLSHSGKVYFFYGNAFYEYDEKSLQIIYPSNNVKRAWFGCSNSRQVFNENLINEIPSKSCNFIINIYNIYSIIVFMLLDVT